MSTVCENELTQKSAHNGSIKQPAKLNIYLYHVINQH